MLGGLPGTQCLDISIAAQLVIKSEAAIAQADLEKYYDNLKPIAIARYLISKGCDVSLAVGCVKVQLLPNVDLAVLGGVHGTGCRTGGALTGRRVAASLGHVPVCDAMNSSSTTMKLYGFKLDRRKTIIVQAGLTICLLSATPLEVQSK